jgi:hypothetical protein
MLSSHYIVMETLIAHMVPKRGTNISKTRPEKLSPVREHNGNVYYTIEGMVQPYIMPVKVWNSLADWRDEEPQLPITLQDWLKGQRYIPCHEHGLCWWEKGNVTSVNGQLRVVSHVKNGADIITIIHRKSIFIPGTVTPVLRKGTTVEFTNTDITYIMVMLQILNASMEAGDLK